MYGHVITKFSRMGRLLHFLTHGAPLARFAPESSAIRVKDGRRVRDGHIRVLTEVILIQLY